MSFKSFAARTSPRPETPKLNRPKAYRKGAPVRLIHTGGFEVLGVIHNVRSDGLIDVKWEDLHDPLLHSRSALELV